MRAAAAASAKLPGSGVRLSRSLLGSVAIQGLGAVATFAIGVLIAMTQGPVAQGRYGLVRSSADLLVALALFGLPQSLVHVMNQRGTSAAALERLCHRYVAVIGVTAVGACVLSLAWPDAARAVFGVDSLELLLLLLGATGWVLQGLQRVFVLCRGTAVQFGWLSVTPALSLLLAVAALLAFGSDHYEWALFGSGVASAWFGARQLRALHAAPGWREGGAPPLGELLRAGAHAFAQSAAMALQPWLSLLLLRQQGASAVEVGHFVFAAYVYQAFALPASFVAPLLFARISRAVGSGGRYEVRGAVVQALVATTLAAVACAGVLPWAVPGLFGAAYAPTVAACVVMALGGPLVVLNRLGVSVLLGQGRFRAASLHAMWRALLVPACMLPMFAAVQRGAWPGVGRGMGWDASSGGGLVLAAACGWWLVEALCGVLVLWMWIRPGDPAGAAPLATPIED